MVSPNSVDLCEMSLIVTTIYALVSIQPVLPCADPEGGTPPPLKNHKNIGFLSNTGLDPLKITKLPSQHSMLGHHRHASETPFKWRLAGGSMIARL